MTQATKSLRLERLASGLKSVAEAAKKSKTPYATWLKWETKTGQNHRRVPGIAYAWLELYREKNEAKK